MDQSLPPSLSLSPVPRHGRSLHGRVAVTPRPEPLPHLPDASQSSASTFSPSSPRQVSQEAPFRLHCHRLQPAAAEIASTAPFAPVIPRARRPPHDDHRELLPILPLSVPFPMRRSHRTELSRMRRRLRPPPTRTRRPFGPLGVSIALAASRAHTLALQLSCTHAVATARASPRLRPLRPSSSLTPPATPGPASTAA